jgi:hypothetical protein
MPQRNHQYSEMYKKYSEMYKKVIRRVGWVANPTNLQAV